MKQQINLSTDFIWEQARPSLSKRTKLRKSTEKRLKHVLHCSQPIGVMLVVNLPIYITLFVEGGQRFHTSVESLEL